MHVPRIPFFNKRNEDDPEPVGMGDEATAPPVPETGGHHELRHLEDIELPDRFRKAADELPE